MSTLKGRSEAVVVLVLVLGAVAVVVSSGDGDSAFTERLSLTYVDDVNTMSSGEEETEEEAAAGAAAAGVSGVSSSSSLVDVVSHTPSPFTETFTGPSPAPTPAPEDGAEDIDEIVAAGLDDKDTSSSTRGMAFFASDASLSNPPSEAKKSILSRRYVDHRATTLDAVGRIAQDVFMFLMALQMLDMLECVCVE